MGLREFYNKWCCKAGLHDYNWGTECRACGNTRELPIGADFARANEVGRWQEVLYPKGNDK